MAEQADPGIAVATELTVGEDDRLVDVHGMRLFEAAPKQACTAAARIGQA
jgi:hypothetical protein